mgnify:CR=1 FL=1
MHEFDLTAINTLDELKAFLPKELDSKELDLITAAYNFALDIHGDTLRISGETQISHVLTVAKYVSELNLDVVSIVAAILHDVIERSPISMNEIDKQFGTDVAFIVDGLSHIRKLSQNVEIDDDHLDMENFKKLIFNATEDVRILIVRLLEKLHSLVNIDQLSEEKQKRAAERALKIYGPLAEYLGLGIVQALIEEHAFKILKPEEYKIITEQIDIYFKSSKEIFESFESEITHLLKQYNINYYPIQVRKKSIYSAYLKIKRKFLKDNQDLKVEHVRGLFDIYAARIIVDTMEECYMVLGLVQSKYGVKPEEFNDYIDNPKPNGYKSIHLLLNYMGTTLELQIRTKEMHEYNEYGPASHVIYKLKSKGESGSFTLTEDLMKWQDKGNEKYRIKLFADSVFVFTPKGLVIRLDKGSTPIDFAFRIHTDIGYKYVGAKVNGKMVSMDYKLQTGDVVEIIMQKKDNVTLDWLKHAFMVETKARIRRRL